MFLIWITINYPIAHIHVESQINSFDFFFLCLKLKKYFLLDIFNIFSYEAEGEFDLRDSNLVTKYKEKNG